MSSIENVAANSQTVVSYDVVKIEKDNPDKIGNTSDLIMQPDKPDIRVPVEKVIKVPTNDISGYTLPETGEKYTDKEVEKAQSDFDKLSPEKQKTIQKKYENGIKEYQKAVEEAQAKSGILIGVGLGFQVPSVDEFLSEHPEYAKAFNLMGPIAQDYNDFLQERADEYKEKASLGVKIALSLGFKTLGFKKHMDDSVAYYKTAWQVENLEKEYAEKNNKNKENTDCKEKTTESILEKYKKHLQERTS